MESTSVGATREPLPQRLRDRIEVVDLTTGRQPEPEAEPEPEPEPDPKSMLKPTSKLEAETDDVRSSPAMNWSKLTQVELRTLLRCFGIRTDGNKAALVSRLDLHTKSAAEKGGEVNPEEQSRGDRQDVRVVQKKRETGEERKARESKEATARARRPQIVSWDIETTIPRFRGDVCQ